MIFKPSLNTADELSYLNPKVKASIDWLVRKYIREKSCIAKMHAQKPHIRCAWLMMQVHQVTVPWKSCHNGTLIVPYYMIHASIFSFGLDTMMEREGLGKINTKMYHALKARSDAVGRVRRYRSSPRPFRGQCRFNSSEQTSKLTSSFGWSFHLCRNNFDSRQARWKTCGRQHPTLQRCRALLWALWWWWESHVKCRQAWVGSLHLLEKWFQKFQRNRRRHVR